jgi:hypothetical protein
MLTQENEKAFMEIFYDDFNDSTAPPDEQLDEIEEWDDE